MGKPFEGLCRGQRGLVEVAAVYFLLLREGCWDGDAWDGLAHLGRRSVHERLLELLQGVDPKLVTRLHLELSNHVLLLLLVEGVHRHVAAVKY